ncbi:MAG: hypothetical protein N3E38_03340, partial [Candidatus Aenigmarchaeota archaeon]|nr:hypothetical protein [Candidatus Aenigmarchaeota archaeon]
SDYVYSSRNILHINKWVEDSLLHTLIKNCKAVILPYLITSQFSGCAALAFHFRKPILASRIPAFEEWVDEGKTGWFFSVGGYNDLSEKMNI